MLYYLLPIFFGLLSYHCYIRYRRTGRLTSKVPGPFPLPFFGNILHYDVSSPDKLWNIGRYYSNNWYPISKMWSFTVALFSVRHPSDLEVLLTSPKSIQKGYVYDLLHPWLKTGLLTSKGEKWKRRRKILTPAFHFNIIKKYMVITEEQADILIKNLKSEGKETTKSLIPFCSQVTLNIICESAMGIALDKLEHETILEYKQALYTFGQTVVHRMPRPWLRDWLFNLFPSMKISRDIKESITTLHGLTEKIVKERKQYHESTGYKYLQGFTDDVDESVDALYMGRKKRLAMLDLLLLAERDGLINEAGVKEEVDTFTFEGHDTTAMAMTFALLVLAEHEEAQNKARKEIVEIINKNNGKFGLEQIQECYYFDRCIKESLRLYPAVPTILRHTDNDTELQLKHALLPAGSEVMLHIFDAHRDPNFWPEPEKFDPDRFLPENCKGRHPFAYIPFSAGPRNCIGQKFAINELKSIIGRILYNFYLQPVDHLADIKFMSDLVLRTTKPIYLKFIQVDQR